MLRNSNFGGKGGENLTLSVSIVFSKEAVCLFAYFNGVLFSNSTGSQLGEKLLPHWPLFPAFYIYTNGSHVFRKKESMSHYWKLCQRCSIYSAVTDYLLCDSVPPP